MRTRASPRDLDTEFNLVLPPSCSRTLRAYLYIFEICGELMQVVRDKIANIWAATVTLKYCAGRQSQLCPTIPLSTCTIPIFQSLIFQYLLNCDCILSFSSPHIPILIATEKGIDPSPCYKTATQSNAAVKTN